MLSLDMTQPTLNVIMAFTYSFEPCFKRPGVAAFVQKKNAKLVLKFGQCTVQGWQKGGICKGFMLALFLTQMLHVTRL